MKGWKEKFLSKAGKKVLIKLVAHAIPNYIMGCFLLPHDLCNKIELMISNFWWGSKEREKKIHWTSWRKLCNLKCEGGMGFQSFQAFKLAWLAK